MAIPALSWTLNNRAAIGVLAAIKDPGVTEKFISMKVDGSPDIKIFSQYEHSNSGPVAYSDGTKVAEVIEAVVGKEVLW